MTKRTVPVLGFAAWSGTGKTGLLVKLIPLLNDRGIRVALIKRAHKDSYELRKAGAGQVLIALDKRQALLTEAAVTADSGLGDLMARLDLASVDLVLVEGFRHAPIAKIELHRP